MRGGQDPARGIREALGQSGDDEQGPDEPGDCQEKLSCQQGRHLFLDTPGRHRPARALSEVAGETLHDLPAVVTGTGRTNVGSVSNQQRLKEIERERVRLRPVVRLIRPPPRLPFDLDFL